MPEKEQVEKAVFGQPSFLAAADPARPARSGVLSRELRGLLLLSGGVLLYELLLMRVFSVLMWYHFASLAIGLALLGLGGGGLLVGTFPGAAGRQRWAWWAAGFGAGVLCLLGFLAAVRAAPDLARATLAPFHQPFYEPFAREAGSGLGAGVVGRLAALACLAGMPFFFAGVATSGALASFSPRIQFAYGATFLGSAAGCLLCPVLLRYLSAPAALSVSASLGFLGAWQFAGDDRSSRAVTLALSVACGAVTAWTQTTGGAEVPFARGMYESKLLAVRWNAMSRVAAFALPSADLERAFGVSRNYDGPSPEQIGLVVDDSGYTNLYGRKDPRENQEYYRSNLVSLAYRLRPGAKSLILGPGGGKDVLIALAFPGTTVQAVEINPQVVEMVQQTFGEFTGKPYSDPRVRLAVTDGRRFAALAREKYDIVEASALFGRLPPAAGAFTLSEDLLHTVEAFRDYWKCLTPRGVLSLSRFVYEQRALRLVALARALLEREGVRSPGDHIRVVSDRGLANVLVGRSPFSPEDDAILADAVERLGFTMLYPSAPPTALTRLVDEPALGETLASLAFDVSPPTDDRPFFYYTLRPLDFFRGAIRHRAGFDDRGAQVLGGAFLVLGGLTVLSLLVPLALSRGLPRGSLAAVPPLAYAALVGTGYIVLEIGTMKRLSLFLGHPVYAASATLFAFLVGGGAGSLLSGRIAAKKSGLFWVLLCAAALGAVQALLVPRLLSSWITLPDGLRYAAAALLLLPLAFVLGIPFPAGVALAGGAWRDYVPWAWAVNGAASVVGSLGTVLVAMNFGYTATLLCGAALYGLAALALLGVPSERAA